MSKPFKKLSFFCNDKKKPGISFSVGVKVSQAGQFYFPVTEIPERIRKVLSREFEQQHYGDNLSSETLNGLRHKVEKLISKFEEFILDEGSEKVILYRIALQGDLTPDLAGDDKGSRRHHDLRGQGIDLGLGIAWKVVLKVKVMGETRYKYANGHVFNKDSDMEVMTWTPEREQWFEVLETTIRNLLARIDNFFGDLGPKELSQFIDSGKPLLPGPKRT